MIFIHIHAAILSQNTVIEEMRNDIFRFCKQAIKLAIKHIEEFNKYKALWTKNQKDYLGIFLKYGRGLTDAEVTQMAEDKEFKVKEVKPTLDMFKDEVFLQLCLSFIFILKFENVFISD